MQRQPALAPHVLDTALQASHPDELPLAVCRFWALLLLTVGLNFFSFKVHGWHHVAAAERLRAIICFNHVSYLDGIVIGSIFAPCGVAKVSFRGVWHPLRLTQWHLQLVRPAGCRGQRQGCVHAAGGPCICALAYWVHFCALWGGQGKHCVHIFDSPCVLPAAKVNIWCVSMLLAAPAPDTPAHGLSRGTLRGGPGQHLRQRCSLRSLCLTWWLIGYTFVPCIMADVSICSASAAAG